MKKSINESINNKIRKIIYILIGIILLLLVISSAKSCSNNQIISSNNSNPSKDNILSQDNASLEDNNSSNDDSLSTEDSTIYPQGEINDFKDNITSIPNENIDSSIPNTDPIIPDGSDNNKPEDTEDNNSNENNNSNIVNLYIDELIKANNTFKYLLNYTNEIINNY